MIHRSFALAVLLLAASTAALAQASQEARYQLIRTMVAEQAAARVAMPFGGAGVVLTDAGEIDQEQLAKEIKKNGRSIEPGKVVKITAIDIGDKSIEIELDGGGKPKRSILDRIQVGIGGAGGQTTPTGRDEPKQEAKGSKVTLKFSQKIPEDFTPDQLKQLLDPVLDFKKSNFLRTGIDSLPPEFQEAVKNKEARIGMDKSTVRMALGAPYTKMYETTPEGVEQEDWLYPGPGVRQTLITFENDVVVSIKQY